MRAVGRPRPTRGGYERPLADAERVDALAPARESRLVELPVGHLDPASGHGSWPRAERGWCSRKSSGRIKR
ncbi:hypothetical protein AMK22_30090 [Streptomyces sp. CB01580]|nr:hypothetical protein AMK22_30090 [Streptomyces sp. CB01580]